MSDKTIIHIFGNPLLDFDNLPLELAPKLEKLFPKIDFVISDPSENFKPINKKLVIIDTIKGIEKVIVLNEIEKLKINKAYSLHDSDLAFNLKLLGKIGKLKKIKIFGVPMNGDKKEILKQLTIFIKSEL